MTKKFQQDGDIIPWTNGTGAAVASGSVVVIANMIGIAVQDVAIAGIGSVALCGVFSGVPKVSGAVFAQGEKLLWDVSAGAFDDGLATPATGDVSLAVTAWKAGVNLETTCTILLEKRVGTVT